MKINYPWLYQISAEVTPLAQDCGKLCQSICCQAQEGKTLGMYLFPGEEVMFSGQEDWLVMEKHDCRLFDFPAEWQGSVYFMICTRPCPRNKRPLSCRLFPVTPHLLLDGSWILIYETMNLPYKCPLIEERRPLQKEFIEMAALVWQELLKDEKIRILVAEDSREREQEDWENIEVLWPF
ncbi:MAG: hypothetical protein MJ157_01285 [Clostridia bacterium]|nr:hypothetical protein [Clostridia bacterium]